MTILMRAMLVLLSVLLSTTAQAQSVAPLPPATSLLPPPYVNPLRTLDLLRPLRARSPARVDLHLRAALEGTALGLTAPTEDERIAHLESSVEAARAAFELAPEDPEAAYWLAASLGLLADQQGGRTKISLAREAHGCATYTLRLDPRHGGAHHIVGRLHAGAKRLGWATRMIARGLGLGAVLNEASWESAEAHLRTAIEEDPDPLVHTFELARLLLERAPSSDEGRELLRWIGEQPARHALDAVFIQRAKALQADSATLAAAQARPHPGER